MGNSGSVSEGNKAQVDTNACEWYKLLNLRGDGEFAALTRTARKTRDFTELDAAIKEKIQPYLYNNGEGRYIPSSELIHVRRCYREGKTIRPPDFSHGHFTVKKKTRFPNKFLHKDSNSSLPLPPKVKIAPSAPPPPKQQVKTTRGKHKDFANLSGESMRFVCWDIYQRGTVGETILHACLLLGLPLYAILAKRLLHIFPKLIVDIYISDQYYGESVLHMAIVNEDPAMVKYLLDRDEWELHKCRCVGFFFSAFDQSDARSDVQGSELIQLNTAKTNYKGFVHYGEYPLSFAVCLNQEECVRLLLAQGAKCNSQDSNGNTVLHMTVIHNRLDMFDLVYNLGASLKVKNKRDLTPLTLAAELGHLDMYNHILMKERRIQWTYGGTTCAEYPLCDIDTVTDEGHVNNKSALHLIVYGKEKSHLAMVDGTILTLLEEKWRCYVRFKYFKRFILFSVYYFVFGLALFLRPNRVYVSTAIVNGTPVSFTSNISGMPVDGSNLTANSTHIFQCFLLRHPDGLFDNRTIGRFVLESMSVLGALVYLISACHEAKMTGLKTFGESLQSEPASKGMFLFSCLMVVFIVPGRAACAYQYEDILAVLSVLCTCPYFLFFCRGFHAIGPFVLMIYKMIASDFVQFLASYCIFLVSFSQAMYLAFRGYNGQEGSPFTDPFQAIFGLFYMSMGDFGKLYDSMQYTRHEYLAKMLFIVYMLIVTLILMNMLIAMMGNTYQLVNDTEKEYLRQWAQVILAIEHSVSKADRLENRRRYSEPMGDGRRALVVRWRQSELEKKDLKERRDQIKQEQREQFVKRRREHMKKSARNFITRQISDIEEELYQH